MFDASNCQANWSYPNLKLASYGRNGFVKVANKLLDNNSRSLHRGLPLKAIQEFGQNSIFLYGPPIERSRRAHSNPLLTAILCLILHEACIEVVLLGKLYSMVLHEDTLARTRTSNDDQLATL